MTASKAKAPTLNQLDERAFREAIRRALVGVRNVEQFERNLEAQGIDVSNHELLRDIYNIVHGAS